MFGWRKKTMAGKFSAERRAVPLSISVLLAEPMTFRVAEVAEALREDYPELGTWDDPLWGGADNPGYSVTRVCNTAAISFGALTEPRTRMMMTFISTPGPLQMDLTAAIELSKGFPGAREAVLRHRSQFTISIKTETTDLGARFLAAQALTCVAAVFARMPNCLGVFFSTAQLLLSSESCVDAAEKAVQLQWPFLNWIALRMMPITAPDNTLLGCRVHTSGLSAFLGCELDFAPAPVPPEVAVKWCLAGMHMLLAGGHVFQDGSTCGDPQDELGLVRMRFQPESSELPVDVWKMFHNTTPIDHEKELGRLPRRREQVNMADDEDFLLREVRRTIETAQKSRGKTRH